MARTRRHRAAAALGAATVSALLGAADTAPFSCAAAPAGSASRWDATECAALASLYDATRGVGWSPGRWSASPDGGADYCGTFFGVRCDGAGHVVACELPYNSLTGTLPAALGNLSALTRLNVAGNFLRGSLPDTLALAPALRTLNVSYNYLNGTLPAALGASGLLTTLSMDSNLLNASGVPAAVCPFACASAAAFSCNDGAPASAACAPACAAVPCAPRCAALPPPSAADYARAATPCSNASLACSECLTALLVPLVMRNVSLGDLPMLGRCIVEHTWDSLDAGAAPAVLTSIYNCPATPAPCPGRLPASAFLGVVDACARPELACTACLSAVVQPFIMAGFISPANYGAGFSRADYDVVSGCVKLHGSVLQSVGVNLQSLYLVGSQCGYLVNDGASGRSSGSDGAAAQRRGAIAGGVTAGGVAAMAAAAAGVAWRRRRRAAAAAAASPAAAPFLVAGKRVSPPSTDSSEQQQDPSLHRMPVQLRRDDVAIENIIGRGGQAAVYRARWCGALVAVKSFEPLALLSFGGGSMFGSSFAGTAFSGPSDVAGSGAAPDAGSQASWTTAPLARTLAAGADAPPTLLRELALLQSLRHPNILSVYGMVLSPPLLVMELAPAGSLSALLRSPSPPPPLASWAARLGVAEGVSCGVEFLHSQNPPLLHRDLKSANVVLSAELVPKLCDFGISGFMNELQVGMSASAVGTAAGTAAYMAPEVALGRRSDVPTALDVYGVGVVLHDLTHQGLNLPHGSGGTMTQQQQQAQQAQAQAHADGSTAESVTQRSAASPVQLLMARKLAGFVVPIGPHVPPSLAALLRRCLAVEPGERPRSSELRGELARLRGAAAAGVGGGSEWEGSAALLLRCGSSPRFPAA